MYGIIDSYNFKEMEPMKYYSPPNSWSSDKKKQNATNKIYSGEWYGAKKMDGYFSQFIKDEDGNCMILSRSRGVDGTFPDKYEWIPHLHDDFDKLPNGTCLLGELYLPSKPGSRNITTILGCLKDKAIERQNGGEKLHFYCFDCLAWNGKNYINEFAQKRFEIVENLSEYHFSNFFSYAKYYTGTELWGKLQEYLANGEEGVVITRGEAMYQPGKRPSKDTLKIKKELANTIDCFFTGIIAPPTKEYTGKEIETWKYWIETNSGKKLPIDDMANYFRQYSDGVPIQPVTKSYYYNFAGSLEIGVLNNDKKIVPIGFLSGLTEEIKKEPQKYKFKCIEINAMEMDVSGKIPTLRHAKFMQFRPDLSVEDCTLEKIIE